MTPSARLQAAIELLDEIIVAARENGASADTLARKFFAARRYAGSKDRRAIRDLAWDAIRQFGERPRTARSAFVTMADHSEQIAELFDDSGYGPAAISQDEPRADGGALPEWLLPMLPPFIDDAERAALLERAPLDLRVNSLKTDRDVTLAELGQANALAAIETGIRLSTGAPIEQHALMLNGSIEIQDLGSQLIAAACQVAPGMAVLDLCAGAGGKSLALAAAMDNQGKLLASDTNRNRLDQLVPRATRAGAMNIETRLLNPGKESQALSDMAGKCDLVLVDAPCSGSGTWRRNPETRWRLNPDRLQRVVAEQEKLLRIAAEMVAPGGHLVYAVCSLLDEEGRGQVANFLNAHHGWRATVTGVSIGRVHGDGLLLTPAHDGSDGFFMARLSKL
jgi:16S rRNA (cytosine967-C5)-methyltransferase